MSDFFRIALTLPLYEAGLKVLDLRERAVQR